VLGTYSERVETFLASSIPNLITQDAVFEAAFLCQKCCTNSGLFVCLEFVRDLESGLEVANVRKYTPTKRRTTEDLPTAASPMDVYQFSFIGKSEGERYEKPI
jgi:hypothetical protein